MSPKDIVFVFDFDGVIVNTVEALNKVYFNFLKHYSKKGTLLEFNKLNGPKLPQIITFLKKKYKLQHTNLYLLNQYNKLLNDTYETADLNPGVKTSLSFIKKGGYKIALASSCHESIIRKVLKKKNLTKYFDLIIPGNKVKKGKPDPEIYNAIKQKIPAKFYFVIEDSINGVKSALDAGLNVIYFNPNKANSIKGVYEEMESFSEIQEIIIKINSEAFSVANFDEVKLSIDTQATKIRISEKQQELIDKVWEKNPSTLRENKLIFSYSSHTIKNNKATISGFYIPYKLFYAQEKMGVKIDIFPVGVSGIVIDNKNNVLIAKRKNVTQYPGFYEFTPSGSINKSINSKKKNNPNEQLVNEIVEETGINQSKIKSILPFTLLFDPKSSTFDICYIVYLKVEFKKLVYHSEEYSGFTHLNLFNLNTQIIKLRNKIIPTSKLLGLKAFDLILNPTK